MKMRRYLKSHSLVPPGLPSFTSFFFFLIYIYIYIFIFMLLLSFGMWGFFFWPSCGMWDLVA